MLKKIKSILYQTKSNKSFLEDANQAINELGRIENNVFYILKQNQQTKNWLDYHNEQIEKITVLKSKKAQIHSIRQKIIEMIDVITLSELKQIEDIIDK